MLHSPCLDDVRSSTDDGHMRVSSARSEGSLQIFAVGVLVRRCSWLSCVVATSTCSLDIFCIKIRFLQPSILVVKDCKPVLLEVFLRPMFFLRVLDLVVSSKWFLRSSKPCVWRWRLQVSLSLTTASMYFSSSGGRRTIG